MLVILGESGSGKTTLIEKLIKRKPELKRVITYTTRPKRQNEADYIDYNFISDIQFQRLEESNFFAESMCYRGWHYGIAKKDCMEENAVAILTPHGLRMMKALGIPVTSVYLYVDRKSRLIKMLERGDDIEEAYRRNLTDVGEFDGVVDEVDFIVNNPCYSLSKENIVDLVAGYISDNNCKQQLEGQINLFEGETE